MFLGTESQRREQMEEMDKKCVGRMADIVVHGLTQNNLKHVTFRIPKRKSQCLPECPALANPVLFLIPLPQSHSGR